MENLNNNKRRRQQLSDKIKRRKLFRIPLKSTQHEMGRGGHEKQNEAEKSIFLIYTERHMNERYTANI